MTRSLSSSGAAKTLGAAAAGVLLIGGAATYSSWSDTEQAPGTTISAGEITLGPIDCGTSPAGWFYTSTSVAFTSGADIVPGQSLTQVCTTELTVVGAQAEATLTVPELDWSATNALTGQVTLATSYEVDDGTGFAALAAPGGVATVDQTNDGDVVRVTMTVDFDFASATNASNIDTLDATLADVTIALQQTTPPLPVP